MQLMYKRLSPVVLFVIFIEKTRQLFRMENIQLPFYKSFVFILILTNVIECVFLDVFI